MKKITVVALVFCLVVSVFAGCGMELDGTHSLSLSTDPATNGSSSTKPAVTDPGKTEPTQPDDQVDVTLEETVIFDKSGIVITVTGIEEGWDGSIELKVRAENNTDKNIVFSGTDFIVNGIVLTAFAYVDVAAGKKTNEVITFYSEDLQTVGIAHIATIICPDAYIFDSDSYDTLFEAPFSVRTSIADEYVQTIDESGEVVYEENGIKVVAQMAIDEFYGYSVRLMVTNDRANDIIVSAEDISVNGYTISAWLYDTVYVDAVRYCMLLIPEDELEKNEITDIEEITFALSLIDSESYDTIDQTDEIKLVVVD